MGMGMYLLLFSVITAIAVTYHINKNFLEYQNLIPKSDALLHVSFERREYLDTGKEEYFLNGKRVPFYIRALLKQDLAKVLGKKAFLETEFIGKSGNVIPDTDEFLASVMRYESMMELLWKRSSGNPHRRQKQFEAPYYYKRSILKPAFR